MRSPEEILALHEAEQAEKDNIKAREEILQLLCLPGWVRFQKWLSDRRDFAFQQLRGVQGTTQIVAESFWKWQQVDSVYEDIEHFIKQTIEQGDDILRRQQDNLQESFLREELYGRSDRPGSSPTGN